MRRIWRSLTDQLRIVIKLNTIERARAMSYTKEQTKYIIEKYQSNPTRETVEELSNELERSTKSIIGKLSREGVYRREVYRSKTGELPITKIEIVNNIADGLGIEPESISGLEKSPKAALKALEEAVAGFDKLDEDY